MKTKVLVTSLALLALDSILNSQLCAAPLGTAFTYQGRLADGGNAATGLYDLLFALFDAPTNGVPQGIPVTKDDVPVTNGLFTVELDFGTNLFTGEARWLEIGVRSGSSTGIFTLLTPRQALAPTPYAFYAPSAGSAGSLTGSVQDWQLSPNIARLDATNQVFLGVPKFGSNEQTGGPPFQVGTTNVVAGLNADTLDGLHAADFWQLKGNANTAPGVNFLGTTDNKALELKVNNARALRLEPTAGGPNVVGGADVNSVSGVGATIAGGGNAGTPNNIAGDYSTIGGGKRNTIGVVNVANTDVATIGGGDQNAIGAAAINSTIGGGLGNIIGDACSASTIGGGSGNAIQDAATYDVIAGGANNLIDDLFSGTIAGGRWNGIYPDANCGTVGGGFNNGIYTNAEYATIGGGEANTIKNDGRRSVISGGGGNIIETNAQYATIGGGGTNFIGAGADYATVPGGRANAAAGAYSFAAGRRAKANHQGAFVWADATDADFASTAANQFLIRATNGVGINKNNPATALDVAGTVTATAFVGDGSGLSGIAISNVSSGQLVKSLNGLKDDVLLAAGANVTLTTNGNTLQISAAGGGIGEAWSLTGNAGTTAGTHFVGTTDNQALELRVNSQRGLRLEPGGSNSVNVIGGWAGNSVAAGVAGATVAGGGAGSWISSAYSNRVEAHFGTISGGRRNAIQAQAMDSTIGGGDRNTVQTVSDRATIGGGYLNTVQTYASTATIGGGLANTVEYTAHYATIGGGGYNTVQNNGYASSIGGGESNTIQTNAGWATIPGGAFNAAGADYAFAAGYRAKANHTGAFVWADSQGADFASTAANQFLIRAAGGVGIGKTNPVAALDVAGEVAATQVRLDHGGSDGARLIWRGGTGGTQEYRARVDTGGRLAFFPGEGNPTTLHLTQDNKVGIGRLPTANALEVAGDASKSTAGSWLANSDARIKTDVRPLRNALATVNRLRPVAFRYSAAYRRQHPEIRDVDYYNVVAQEFAEVFPEAVRPGGDRLTSGDAILQVDTHPAAMYALAAIQELHQQVQARDAEIQGLKASVTELKALVNTLAAKPNGGAQ